MKILFLGLFYDEEGLAISYKDLKDGIQIAPHRYQTLLLQGFADNGVEVQSIHVLPGGSFPFKHKRLFIKDKRWGKDNFRIGFLNLPIIKKWAQEKKAYREMKRVLTGDNPPDAIICYYTHMPFLKALCRIKKEYPKVKTMLIMTEPVPGKQDTIENAYRRRLGDKMVSLCKSLDTFCLLTKYMAEPLAVGDRPYVVCEGVADETAPLAQSTDGQEKIFLYTGSIYKGWHVDTLIEAFSYLPEAKLWLCGSLEDLGESSNLIKELPNVTYLGFLPFEQLQTYRDKCSYLINPRRPVGTYTKYNFPSKTMEYLVSGKPTVGYWLEGMGEDYYPYINRVYGNDAESLAEDLKALMERNYEELQETALRAREYVLQEKTGKRQAKKIIDLLQ